jgi:hypothetical protein
MKTIANYDDNNAERHMLDVFFLTNHRSVSLLAAMDAIPGSPDLPGFAFDPVPLDLRFAPAELE